MNYNIQFQISGLCIIVVLLIVYFSKKRLKSLQNLIFCGVMIVTFLVLVLDIISVYTIVNRDTLPRLNMFLSKAYLVFLLLFIYSIDIYTLSNTLYDGIPKWRRNIKYLAAGIMTLGLVISTVVIVVNELYFGGTDYLIFSYGTPAEAVYLYSGVSVGAVIAILLINHKHIPIQRQVAMYVFCISEGVIALIQKISSTILIVSFGASLIVLIIYFALENPDLDMIAALEQSKKDAEKAREEADAANNAKSAFLSNMSHEIRTPMNAIIGLTDVIMRNEHSPEEADYLMNIKNSGDALLTIINDILDLSKIESGKFEIIENEYEPLSMVNDMGMLFWNRIGDKDIDLIFDIDKNLPAKLSGDVVRIRQVIVNLMNNATKFTEKGQVKLEIRILEHNEDSITLRYGISDTGQGIKQEEKERLFTAFSQVNTKINHGKEGTGLGLSISKQLVTLMGGNIGVNSEYGKGSEFFFTLTQKVISDEPAVALKNKSKQLTVGGKWKSRYAENQFRSLAEVYGLTYLGNKLLPDIDYFFTDDEDFIKDESVVSMMRDENNCINLCYVHNPMRSSECINYVTTVHKPLYTLNFCNILNGDEAENTQKAEDYIDFIAPDAEVLLVDDNEMNRLVADKLMEPMHMKIDMAENGKEAVDMVRNKHYDLVLMDHMMPIMDGIEATKIIRQTDGDYYKTLPIIALTANGMEDARNGFLEAGMNDFVSKPIQIKEISKKIKRWIPGELIMSRTEADDTNDDDDIDVPEIDGLDIQEGIKNSGSKKLFMQLLGDFYRLIDMKSTKIEKCLADGMIKDYTIEVHALKNTARMIGAMELSEKFAKMEQYGNAEDIDALNRETNDVLEMYRSYKTVLKPFSKNVDEGKEEIPKQDIIWKLEMLVNAIDTFDIDTADDVMNELSKIKIPDECTEQMELLVTYYADLAMNEITETSNNMIEILQAALS